MRNILCTAIFMVSSFMASAQLPTFAIKESAVIETSKRAHHTLAFSVEDGNGGNIVGMSYGDKHRNIAGYSIERYDLELNVITSYDYPLEDSSIATVFAKDGKFHIIECVHDKKAGVYDVNVLTTLISEFNFSKKKLFSFPELKKRNTYQKYLKIEDFSLSAQSVGMLEGLGLVSVSENQKYITFSYPKNIRVYDSDFNLITNTKGVRLYKKSLVTDEETGNVYGYGKIKGESNQKQLYRITPSGIDSTTFPMNEKYVPKLKLLHGENKLAAVGFYSKKEHQGLFGVKFFEKVAGVAYYNIDLSSFTVEEAVFSPFDEKFMVDKYGAKTGSIRLAKGEIFNIHMDYYFNYLMTEDHTIYLIAEEFEMEPSRVSSRVLPNYNDIIVAKLNTNGQMEWARNIQKSQHTVVFSDFSDSYKSVLYKETPLIFVNGKDFKMSEVEGVKMYCSSPNLMSLYVVYFDGNGAIHSKKIIDNNSSDFTYEPVKSWINPDDDTLIIGGNDGKAKRQLLKLSF